MQCGKGTFVVIGRDGVHAAVLIAARGESSPSHLHGWNWVIGDIFIFCDMAVNYLSPLMAASVPSSGFSGFCCNTVLFAI